MGIEVDPIMSDFVTAFEITSTSNGVLADTVFRLFIGVACLIGGVSGLIFTGRRKGNGRRNWIGSVFLIRCSSLWLYLHDFPQAFGHIHRLVGAYRNGQYQVVEGEVRVLHEQPATGHTKGDVIAVNGNQFEVNYFYVTAAYRQTIAHGGALRAGVYARIYCCDGEILRLDVRK